MYSVAQNVATPEEADVFCSLGTRFPWQFICYCFHFSSPSHFIPILCFTVFVTVSSLPPTPTEAGGNKLCEYNDFIAVVSLVDFLVTVHASKNYEI